MSHAYRLVLLGCACVLFTGCVHTRVEKIARYSPGDDKLVEPAPHAGVYTVRYTADGRNAFLPHTQRYVEEGQSLGFQTGKHGRLVALVSNERIVLADLPEQAEYCIWYMKDRRPTQFAKECQKIGDSAGQAVATGAAVVGVGAVLAADAYLESRRHDDCDDRPIWQWKH